jgi:hypothetical protein
MWDRPSRILRIFRRVPSVVSPKLAFAVATVFIEVYSDHRWVPWVAYGTAGLIGASRVSLGRHFPSDIVVGAVLGQSMGRMVVARQRETGEPVSRFEPFIDPVRQDAGVVWTRCW